MNTVEAAIPLETQHENNERAYASRQGCAPQQLEFPELNIMPVKTINEQILDAVKELNASIKTLYSHISNL